MTTPPRSFDIAIAKGFQLWLAEYPSNRALEAIAHVDELIGVGPCKGYAILVITDVIGRFIFQATFSEVGRVVRQATWDSWPSAPPQHRLRA